MRGLRRRGLRTGGSKGTDQLRLFAASSRRPAPTRWPRTYWCTGRWHGAWCWKKVVPLFLEAGQRLYTPTLTRLGEKAHLLTPEVGLSTHIQDVVQLIEDNQLSDVILLGHSDSGMVITRVADRLPERIGHQVYLDAVVPRDGESMADLARLVIKRLRQEARAHWDGWRVDPQREAPLGIGGLDGVTQEPDLSWVRANLCLQPLKTLEEPLHPKDPRSCRRKPARLFAAPAAALPWSSAMSCDTSWRAGRWPPPTPAGVCGSYQPVMTA